MSLVAAQKFPRRLALLAVLVSASLIAVLQIRSVRSEVPSPHSPQKRTPDLIAGRSIVNLRLHVVMSPAGYIGPGTRIDVLAAKRFGKQVGVFPLILDATVVEVDRDETTSISVDRTQGLLIELALLRGCELSALLRNPDADANEFDHFYDSEEMIRYLANKGRWHSREGAGEEMPVPGAKPR